MEIIDTVTADAVEVGDIICYEGQSLEVLNKVDLEEIEFAVFNLDTGDRDIVVIPFDTRVDILGA